MKTDIVCVGLVSWPGDYNKSTVQLMNELAKGHRLLFVNYAFTINDVVKHLLGRARIPLRAVLGLTDRLTTQTPATGGTLHVLTLPWTLPINRLPPGALYTALLNWNARRQARCIRRALDRLDFDRPLVINAFHPSLGVAMAGLLNERALIYYCYDDIRAEAWSRQHGERLEKQFLRRVDAVVTTSAALAAAKRAYQPRTFLVENGVDFDQFYQPDALRPASKTVKTIGYIGALDNRIDWSLLERCFTRFPHVQFLLVGRIPDPALAAWLRQFENVQAPGPQPPADLPTWVRQMDVGLIPFVRNEQTRAIYPMKLNEYLATGIPVVATDFTDLSQFDGLIQVAPTTDAFIDALQENLLFDKPDLRSKRIEMARSNSWQHRGQQFSAIIDEVLTRSSAAETQADAVSGQPAMR
ncbi:glycosyltransferase [Spirosoma sordidisoli]|uniref:Glycosyltransferase n=1 Tax=Spirosoma sordidisoli TaxID=2502893 RepID=A0A4Q2UVP0_9BACT|nr:glycosyltransferase [Spirosoma sordidisoli]RYC72081.1 glycosyltransferase [Spirosoma sordidisoli]